MVASDAQAPKDRRQSANYGNQVGAFLHLASSPKKFS